MDNMKFTIKCGDWLYPCKDSGSGVSYKIEKTLALNLFSPAREKFSCNKATGHYSHHLNSDRVLNCELDLKNNKLFLNTVTHSTESEFIINVGVQISFDPNTLDRVSELTSNYKVFIGRGDFECSVFVTAVLLQHYLCVNNDGFDEFLPGLSFENRTRIYFREATIPEIESIGRWK